MNKLAVTILSLFLVACGALPKDDHLTIPPVARPAADPATVLQDASKEGANETTRIESATKATIEAGQSIQKESEEIGRSTESVDVQKRSDSIGRLAAGIVAEQGKIQTSIEDIRRVMSTLPRIASDIVSLQKKIQKLEDQQDAAKQESMRKLYGYLVWFWVIGFVMLIGGGFLTLYAKRVGGMLLGIGLLTVGFASAAHFYFQQIAMIGLVAIVAGIIVTVGVIVWLIIESNRKEKAVKELVPVVEEAKKALPPETKETIFGDKGIANALQSSSTQKLVAQVRKGLVKKGPKPDALS